MSSELLPRVVRALAAQTDAAAVLDELTGLLVPALADWCLADLLQPPDLVIRVAALGPDGPLELPSGLGPVHARRSSAHAVGLLARLVDAPGRRLRLSAEQIDGFTRSPDPRLRWQAELAQVLGTAEVLVLGLASRDELLGVLTLGRTTGVFAAADVEALADVAAVAGLVLEDVRLRELRRGVSTALQRSLLPQLPVVPGVSLAARFTPAGSALAVGGDWYDAFVLPAGELALVVGDATGHDVQAAARMAELRNLLRAIAVDQQAPPAATLSRLDRVMDHLAPDLSGTGVYGQLEGSGGCWRLRWSSAGHLPPVLLRDGRAELLDTPADLMLGVRAGTERFDHELELQPGDVLVLYTDGLVEDRRTGLDERLVALQRLAEETGPGNLERLTDVLVEQLASGDDDVAVLAVRLDTAPTTRRPGG